MKNLLSGSISVFILGLFLLSCQEKKQQQQATTTPKKPREWRPLSCGLYINSKGELGFPSAPDRMDLENPTFLDCPNTFITTLGGDYIIQLIDVVDTNSFQSLGGGFFRDTKHVYHHRAMCDGGYFNIFSNQPKTFEVLGSCYAKDNKQIYYGINGYPVDADYNTFRTNDEINCLAKDKFGYLEFGRRMTENDFNDLPDDLKEKLKAL